MARIGKPPLKRSFQQTGRLSDQEPPAVELAPTNLIERPSAGLKDLNFKVDPQFHQRFKVEAASRGMSMVDLLKAAFWNYVQDASTEER